MRGFAADSVTAPVPQTISLTDTKVPDDLKITYFRLRAALEHVVGQIMVGCKERELTVIKNTNGEEQDLVCHTIPPKTTTLDNKDNK